MIAPLVTALVPTRKRFRQLKQCVISLLTCSPLVNVAIYAHADDYDTREKLFLQPPNDRVKILIGKPRRIHESGDMLTELAKISITPWVWYFNDDLYVTGGEIRAHDLEPGKFIYYPEWHRLGGSKYHFDKGCPFFIIPNQSWVECGEPKIVHPVDLFTVNLLRKHGYEERFIPGLEVWHDRSEKNCKEIDQICPSPTK